MFVIGTKFLSDKIKKNYDQSVEINNNPDCSYILDHPGRILIIGGSGSGKATELLKLIKHQRPDIDKIHLYIKDPLESKYQLLINVRQKLVIKNLKNPKAFIDYSQTIGDVYENLEDYNATNKMIMLIVFDYVIAYIWSNKILSPILNKLFLRRTKPINSLVFILQSYFEVHLTIRLNATRYFIIRIPNKRELQQISSGHSSDNHFKEFVKLYKDYTEEPNSFLVNDTISSTDNPLRFRKNLS